MTATVNTVPNYALPCVLTDDPATMKPGETALDRSRNEERTRRHIAEFLSDLGFEIESDDIVPTNAVFACREWMGQDVTAYFAYYEFEECTAMTLHVTQDGQTLSHEETLSLLREIIRR